jgi:hypothetical protein
MKPTRTPGRIWPGLLALAVCATGAQAQSTCDTLGVRPRHAVDGGVDRGSRRVNDGSRPKACRSRHVRRPLRTGAEGCRVLVAKDAPRRGYAVRKRKAPPTASARSPAVASAGGAPFPQQPVFEAPVPATAGGEVAPAGLTAPAWGRAASSCPR